MKQPFAMATRVAHLALLILVGIMHSCISLPSMFQWKSASSDVPSAQANQVARAHASREMVAIEKAIVSSLSGYRLEDVKGSHLPRVTSVISPGDIIEILYQVVEEFPQAGYKLKPDDKLNVAHVFDPQFDVNMRIDSAGFIYLPLVDKVQVGGLTLEQSIHKVSERYKQFVAKPHILMRIEDFNHSSESRKRTIKTMNVNGPFKEFLVPDDGYISVPFIARIKVMGKTLDQVKEELESEYTSQGLRTEVTVILKQISGRRVFVMGDVQKPGMYPYKGTLNLAQAISMAEGFRKIDILKNLDMADPSAVLVFRTKGVPAPSAYRVSLVSTLLMGTPEGSFPLQTDDVVFVPPMARPRIFVFGEVREPRAHPTTGTMTVTQAISVSRGLLDTACRSSLLLLRKQPDGGPSAVRIDLDKILASGGANDILLGPGDVLYVPKKWISNVNVFIDQWFTKGLYALLPANSPLDFYIDVWDCANQYLKTKRLREEIRLMERSTTAVISP